MYNTAVYYIGMLYLHNDIFVTDIIGYDRLKFSYIYTPKEEILGMRLELMHIELGAQRTSPRTTVDALQCHSIEGSSNQPVNITHQASSFLNPSTHITHSHSLSNVSQIFRLKWLHNALVYT